jgi:membrane protein DedA with SNARE-associated domain
LSQTETLLAKVGPVSLVFSKFLPGISLLSVAMAGITRMPLPLFLLLDGIGALLFVRIAATLGWMFQNEITSAFSKLVAFGLFGTFGRPRCTRTLPCRKNDFSVSCSSSACA